MINSVIAYLLRQHISEEAFALASTSVEGGHGPTQIVEHDIDGEEVQSPCDITEGWIYHPAGLPIEELSKEGITLLRSLTSFTRVFGFGA